MLLNALDVKNSRGSVLNLPLDDISGGFKVRNIDGLSPVKATMVSSSFANLDGEQYHSARREARNILLTLGLQPNYAAGSVKDLRDQLYSYFMPKSEVLLTFHMFDKFATNILLQNLDLNIDARIESFESSLFTSDPAVDLSLMCYSPDFYDPRSIIFEGMSTSGFVDSPLTYDGTVETGVLFTLSPDRDISEFTIYHRPPDQTLRTVDFAYPMVAGDVLQISSVVGAKSVILNHGGVESSVLYALSPQSNWLSIEPGDNTVRVYAGGTPIPYTIEYTNKYGGL